MTVFVPRMNNRLDEVSKFKEKIAHIPIRIIVEGTRGKSSAAMMLGEMLRSQGKNTLVKVTGENPLLIYNGVIFPLYRKGNVALLDYELIPGILNFDLDAIVYENQALTPYTMRYFHQALDPQYVIVPNIRTDHPENMGFSLPEITRNFADNYRVTKRVTHVYYVEPISEVHDIVYPILKKYAEMYPDRMSLSDVTVPDKWRDLPGIENFLVTSFFLRHALGILVDEEIYIQNLQPQLHFMKGSGSLKYMNLAKINDPDSFLRMLSYMLKITPGNLALVGFLRDDRVGRTRIFEKILPVLEERYGPRIKKIWLAGYGTEHMFHTMSGTMQSITTPGITASTIPDIISYVREHNLILITMFNRVNSFMDRLLLELEGRHG